MIRANLAMDFESIISESQRKRVDHTHVIPRRGGIPHEKDGCARRTFWEVKKRYLLGCSASKDPQREL